MQVIGKYLSSLSFEFQSGSHQFVLDTKPPLSKDLGPSPKEMLLASIAGCSGIDVASLLKKYRQSPTSLNITASAEARQEHPRIFGRIDLLFAFEGQELDSEKISEAVRLSMTQYCGVSAMVFQTSPIFYLVLLNGRQVAEGKAQFAI